jgi:rubredoxin
MGDRYLCPVCGYPELSEPPWNNESPSDEICPSCGTQFGYDDVVGGDAGKREALYRRRREAWRVAG